MGAVGGGLPPEHQPADELLAGGPCNLSETIDPLVDWFEQITEKGRATRPRLYGADGWVAFFATNPFGRTSPSALEPEFAVRQRRARSDVRRWMAALLYDTTSSRRTGPFSSGVSDSPGRSEFVLDTWWPRDGTLVIAPSESPENTYIDPETGKRRADYLRIDLHQSLVRAIFEDRQPARILGLDTDAPPDRRGTAKCRHCGSAPTEGSRNGKSYQERNPAIATCRT